MRVVLLALVLVLLSACSHSADKTAQELTAEAQEILRASGRNEVDAQAVQLLEMAVESDPGYLPARQERLNLFLLQEDIGAAVEEAGQIVKIRDIPETRMSYCMLRELENKAVSDRNACYDKVASAVAARSDEPHTDLNYVLALRLSESQDFHSEAEKHIGQLEKPEVRTLVEDLLSAETREELIKFYFPSR